MHVLKVLLALFACTAIAGEADRVVIRQDGRAVMIENRYIRVRYDLDRGMYEAADARTGRVCIENASSRLNDLVPNVEAAKHTFKIEPLSDALGMGPHGRYRLDLDVRRVSDA